MDAKLIMLVSTLAALTAACSEHVLPPRGNTAPAGSSSTTVTPPTAPLPPSTGTPSTPYAGDSTPRPRTTSPSPTPTNQPPACAPIAGSGPVTPWIPPNPLKHPVCSSQEATVMAACFVTGQYCDQLQYVNPQCQVCAVTPANAQTYGALVQYDQSHPAVPNVPGCISALTGDISTNSCGARFNLEGDCEYAACAHCNAQDYDACVDAAAHTTCAAQANAAACAQQPLSVCVQGNSNVDVAIHMIQLFCMP